MKKLKQMSGPYSIGFELSSTAHGFVATDPNGNVLYHGKQPVMGTRVFKEGQHAAEARMPRTSRRGIQRRRGREHEMERVFAPVISPIDPDFFIRRRMSYKLGKIRFESDPIGFSYSRLFHSFPTLAHLDVALMEADSAMDSRLIFEAVANHVVRRGHFLLENQNVSSTNSDIDTQVANYAEVLVSYFEDTLDERIELSLEALDINGNVTARELQKQFASAMCVSGDDIQKKTEKAQIKAIADLVAGYKADLTVLVPDAEKLPKVSISDGDALEEFLADSCPDSLVPVLMAAQALYTSWKLQGMLSYAPGKSLSHNQVAQYDVYGKQLRMLKNLALKYVAKQDADGNIDEDGFKDYVRFFGGPKCEDRYRYDKVQVKKQDSPKKNMGYTAYNLNVLGYEEFAKASYNEAADPYNEAASARDQAKASYDSAVNAGTAADRAAMDEYARQVAEGKDVADAAGKDLEQAKAGLADAKADASEKDEAYQSAIKAAQSAKDALDKAKADDRLVFLTEITACFGGRSACLGEHGIDLEGKLGIRAEAFDGNGIERIQIGIRIDCKVVSHAAVAT